MSIRMRANLVLVIFAAAAIADNDHSGVVGLDDGANIIELIGDLNTVDTTNDEGIIDFDSVHTVDFMDVVDIIGDADIAGFMGLVDTIIDNTSDQTLNTKKATTAASPNLAGTFLGFEAALSIGAIPLFELWQSSLPETMQDLGLAPNFGIVDDPESNDRAFLRYRITEAPSQFNFVIPFGLSLRRADSSGSSLALGLLLFHANKRFQSEIYIDDVEAQNRKIELYELLAYSSMTLEAAYRRPVPSTYFSIDGSQQTFLTLAAGISPLNVFVRSRELRNRALDEDGRMKNAEIAINETLEKLPPITANGTSFMWRVGISTLRNNNMEIGLYYSGSHSFNFYRSNSDERVTQSLINGSESERHDKHLSFMTSRIEFRITFLMSTKRRAENDGDKDANNGEFIGDQTIDDPIDQVIDDPISQTTDERDDQTIDDSIGREMDEHDDQPMDDPIGQFTDEQDEPASVNNGNGGDE